MKRKVLCLLMALLLLLSVVPAALAASLGSSYQVGIISTLSTYLDPLEPLERDLVSVCSLIYEGLIQIDDNYLPQPCLCESWNVSGNGRTWTFNMRKDVTFSDGTPLTAYDVAATANYILDRVAAGTDTYYSVLNYFISEIHAQDYSTLVVKAKRQYYGLLYAMTFPVVPESQLGMANPLGSGPYALLDFVTQKHLTLVTNPNWRGGTTQVKEIYVLFYPTNKALMSAYEYADVEAIVTRSTAAIQYKNSASSMFVDYRTRTLETLMLNNQSGMLSTPNMRMAIRYAIDVNRLASEVYGNMVTRTDTPFISGTWLYSDTAGAYDYSPEKSKALLAAEGWDDSDGDGVLDKIIDGKKTNLSLTLRVYEEPDSAVRVQTANMIATMLSQVDIAVEVVSGTQTDLAGRLKSGNYHMCLCAFNMDVCPDPGFFLIPGNTLNYSKYKSDDMKKLFNSFRAASTQESFASFAYQIQQRFASDCPFICLYYRNGTVLTRKMFTSVRDVRELEIFRGIESMRD